VGIAKEIFLEIAFLKLAKIARGPWYRKAMKHRPIHALAFNDWFATTATEDFTLEKIVP